MKELAQKWQRVVPIHKSKTSEFHVTREQPQGPVNHHICFTYAFESIFLKLLFMYSQLPNIANATLSTDIHKLMHILYNLSQLSPAMTMKRTFPALFDWPIFLFCSTIQPCHITHPQPSANNFY